MPKTIVFIHGRDKDQANTPWMFYHLHPSTYSKPVLSEGETFKLVYFDFEKGERREWDAWSATRSRSAPAAGPDRVVAMAQKAKVRDKSGNPYSPEREYPSVLNFYDWIKAQPSKSIVSLQIFSHAVIYQPVLFADSYEWGGTANEAKRLDMTEDRDPNDTEFRLRDFVGPNNPLYSGPHSDPWASPIGGELAKVRAALADDVFIKVWGCGEQDLNGHGGPIRKLILDFLKAKKGKDGDQRRATLVEAYLDHVDGFFPYRLAERLDLPVWAGPVGWGSDPFDVDGDPRVDKNKYRWTGKFPPNLAKRELWWRISIHFLKNKAIAEKFFKATLKARLDPMGYVEYKKSWVHAARDAAVRITSGSSASSIFDAPTRLMQDLLERIGAPQAE